MCVLVADPYCNLELLISARRVQNGARWGKPFLLLAHGWLTAADANDGLQITWIFSLPRSLELVADVDEAAIDFFFGEFFLPGLAI